jgi:hypothetical protein
VRTCSDAADVHPCLVVFDCVYIDGCVLTAQPLSERLHVLQTRVFATTTAPGRLMMAERQVRRTVYVCAHTCRQTIFEQTRRGRQFERGDGSSR